MKLNPSILLISLVFSLFSGIMVISLGVGAEFTAINKIMAPLICGGGKLEATWEYNVSHPGMAIFDSRWVCVDETTDIPREASLKTNLVAGTAYGLLMFAAFILLWIWVNRVRN